MEARIADKIVFEPMSGCWLWIGAISSTGYGSFWVKGRSVRIHRYLYEQKYGAIPEGLVLDHRCDTRRCANPDHVIPTTNRANVLRGNGATARNARKTCCNNGHLLSGHNLYLRPSDNARMCRACTYQFHQRYRKDLVLYDAEHKGETDADTDRS